MSRIITIHPVKETHRYGFETTQLYRAKVARYLGVDYIHLATSPQVRPDWKKEIIALGFLEEEIINVPNSFSDIGHDALSVRPEDLTQQEGDQVEITEEGFVGSVTLADGTGRYFYTSGPYLFEDFQTGELRWYHGNGELVLRARFMDPFKEPTPVSLFYPGYIYLKDGEFCSEDDLVVSCLAKNAKQTDLIIRDQHIIPAPSIFRFMENTEKNYYEVIHENVLRNMALANLRGKTDYLVASEVLTSELEKQGYSTKFLPPMVTQVDQSPKIIGPVTNYCVVGNMSDLKNVEWIIEVFIALYLSGSKAIVTFYGGSAERIEELKQKYEIPENIIFKGIVDKVPYHLHQAYVSSSYSELFANACVEAMSEGLLAVLSNVDIAHRYYAKQTDGIQLFSTKKELVEMIERMAQEEYQQSNEQNLKLAKQYSIENVANIYRELLGIKA